MTRKHRAGAALFALLLVVTSIVGVAAFAGTAQAAGVLEFYDSVDGAVISGNSVSAGTTVFMRWDGSSCGCSGSSIGITVSNQNAEDITVTVYDDGTNEDSGSSGGGGDAIHWGSFTVVDGSTSDANDELDVVDGNDATATAPGVGTSDTASITADYTAPQIASVTTADTNQDGDVDELAVTFTESIDDSASTLDATTFTLGTGSVGSVATGTADDDSVTITLASPITGTSATPDVDLEAGKVEDTAGNTLGSTQSFTGTTDGAAPVVDSGAYADANADGTVDQVTLTFSEAVTYSTFNADDWSETANGLSGLSLDSLSSGSGTSTLTFGASATAGSTGADGESEPSVAYASGGSGVVEDQASTPNEVVDASGATLSDAAKPTITDVEIKDTAGDGLIDEVVLTFSEYVDTDDGAAPVQGDFGTVTLPDGSTADISGASFSDPAGTTSTVTLSSVAGQGTENTAAGSTDVSGDLSADWVDASAASNALVSTLDDESVTDSAAPVETTATYRDTSGDGTVDRIDVDYSEDVSASTAEAGDYSLGGSDAGSVTVDSAATSGATIRLAVTTSLSAPSLTLDYDATAGTADSVTDGTNPAASFTGVSVADGVAPTLSAATTLDRDGDGDVDAATLTFSEAVSDGSVSAGDYSIGGQTAEAVDTLATADDDTVQIRITTDGNEVSGTDVADVTYSPGGTTDTSGNSLGSVASGDVSETDGAAPVVTSFSLTENTSTEKLDISFDSSESLSTVSVSVSGPESATITSFSVSGTTYTASVDVFTNGDYTATLDTAEDAAGNGASSASDTAAVSFISTGRGGESSSDLSDASSRTRLSGSTGLSEVGVRFGGAAAGTVRVSEMATLAGSPPPGTFVSAAEITVPDSLTETSSTLKFAVSRDRLDELGVDAADLTVYRLHDGSWNPLETRVVDRGGDTVVVEADTPGFSQFAVMAGGDETAASTPAATATATAADDRTDEASDETGDTGTSVPGTDDEDDSSSSRSGDDGTTTSRTPGFGVGVALVALAAFLAVGLRRLG